MKTGKLPSWDSLSQTIVLINDAIVEPRAWETALASIVKIARGQSGSMWMMDGRSLANNFATVRSTTGTPYYPRYAGLDPLLPVVVGVPPGEPKLCSSTVDWMSFLRSEFYNDFARPNDLLDCVMMRVDGGASGAIIGIGCNHAKGRFRTR